MENLGMIVLIFIGITAIAVLTYFFYKKILYFLAGLFIILMTIISYFLINSYDLPWFIIIPITGLITGIICAPVFLVAEVDNLKKELTKLSSGFSSATTNIVAKINSVKRASEIKERTESNSNKNKISKTATILAGNKCSICGYAKLTSFDRACPQCKAVFS